MKKRNLVVSLIGRPNVGKSSIFNSLMKKQYKAITHDMPGVTRDRHYGIAKIDELRGIEAQDVILVDTGGFYPKQVDENSGSETENRANHFFNIMTTHAQMAIEESDLVLFVVDVREGALPFDESICNFIRSKKKEFWLVVNKYDSDKQEGQEIDFYSLGINSDEMIIASAAHGLGMATLREKIQQKAADFAQGKAEAPNLQKGVTPREEVVGRLALIGAPNAGKSTLLNKLIGAQRALVSNIPGTTVDPIEGYFDLYFGHYANELDKEVQISRDDRILYEQYEEFRKNNADFFEKMLSSYEFEEDHIDEEDYLMEGGDPRELLAQQELEEQAFEKEDLSELELSEEENNEIESRLMEQAFDSELVSETEASENDDTEQFSSQGQNFWRSLHIVDTAGIRRKKAIDDFVESQSVYRSLRSITESDVVIFMVDATKGIGHQDRRLLDIALEKGKSVIVALNKMDLMREKLKTDQDRKEWIADLRDDVPWINFCDLLPISAKYNKGLNRLKKTIIKTVMIRRRAIPTSELNRTIFDLIERNPVVVQKSGGRRLRVKYTSMVKSNPPTFLLFSNRSKGIPEHYKRYLRNNIRNQFKLDNTPVHIIFRTGTDLAKRMKKIGSRTTTTTN
ncbi:MAG: GTP-binding protein [Oligoflexia bacterium]|nr:GTP-binding protein [Oligoflexia bacterium]